MGKTKCFVFDTNTLISAFILRYSTAFKALVHSRPLGKQVFSRSTFLELETVLLRKKFDRYLSVDERLTIIQRIADESEFMDVVSDFGACRDPKDNQFLNLAFDSKASAIITGDQDLLIMHPFKNIPILTAADFLERF